MDYDLTYISLGAGVQSSALLVCSALGLHDVPRASVAIFADTQNEPRHVYEQVERLTKWVEPHGIRVEKITGGDLLEDAKERLAGTRSRFASIPMFVETTKPIIEHSANWFVPSRAQIVVGADPDGCHECDENCRVVGQEKGVAIGKRQCTSEYKIKPIERNVRSLLGYAPKTRVKKHALGMVGISADEIYRVKPSRTKWITRGHPLVDARLRRSDCVKIVMDAGLPRPKRSACVFCPYTDDRRWFDMKRNDPVSFEAACVADEALRDQTRTGMKSFSYVHRSLKPLREVDFDAIFDRKYVEPLFGVSHDDPDGADGFTPECEGVCGV